MSSSSARQKIIPTADKIPAKVMVVTGSSGGHIFPALAFLEKLKEKYSTIDVFLVLPRPFCRVEDILEKRPKGLVNNSVVKRIDNLGYRIKYLPISAIGLNFSLKNFFAICNFFKGTLEGLALFIRFGPDIVVAFGSIICIPVVFFAWIFRIKTILHEQNVIPGRANRFLAKIADRIAISFSESSSYLSSSVNRLELTGNPLRQSLKKIDKKAALGFFALSDMKFTVLVTGGSQGSHKINLCFQQAFSGLSDKEKLQVIHLAGDKDYDLLKELYKNFNEDIKLFDFLKDMQYAYSAADLIITRAGATTISEIILFKLPAIIVPYPYAYQHQLANARILEKRGLAVIIEDRLLDERRLKDALEDLLNNRQQLQDMRSGYDRLEVPLAAERLVESALSLYQ
jgi:UDP-N-acetylglucosamine--N-acetylmuramyl-(pentapeptide) pyrophosphoryl-undecaprenol N-acetylglucosamine transferase